MSKLISHGERTRQCAVHYDKNLNEPIQVRVVEEFVENDRIFKRTVLKSVDPRDNFKGVKVSDFYLENVIAAGALDSLKECKLNPDRLSAADNLDVQGVNLDNYIVENSNDEGGNE